MPFKSEAQRRKFYAMEERGEIPKGTTSRWEKETKDKDLPEKVRKKESAFIRAVREKLARVNPARVEALKQNIAASLAKAKGATQRRVQQVHSMLTPQEIQYGQRVLGMNPRELARYQAGARIGAPLIPKVSADLDASNPTKLKQKIEEAQEAQFITALRQKKESGEAIPGGLAKGKPDSKYSPEQLQQGTKIEKEHTPDPAKAKEIAKDHLEEHPAYYTHLGKMEKKLEQKKESALRQAIFKQSAELTQAAREDIPTGEFALPGRRYPIHDKAHAENALARVSQHGTPEERETVRKKVYAKYPELKESFKEREGKSPTAEGMLKKEKLGSAAEQRGAELWGTTEGYQFLGELLKDASERHKAAMIDPMEEQRKQEIHEQQMQFSEDKHQLEMERMQMLMQHQDTAQQTKADHTQQKFDTAQQATADQQAAVQQQMPQSPSSAQQDTQRRQNLLASQSPPQQQ